MSEDEFNTTTFGPLVDVKAEIVGDILIGSITSNPKQAYGDRKVPLHLVPPALGIYAALALREGAIKYGAWNFRDIDVELMTYVGAIKRHLDAIVDGEWMDPAYEVEVDGVMTHFPEKPHMAGLVASAAILIDCYERESIIDNRPKPGTAANLLDKYKL